MKSMKALTGLLALAAALPAQANILCSEVTNDSSVVFTLSTNPDHTTTASLEKDGSLEKYTGTYEVSTDSSPQPDGPFKILNASLVNEAGQAATFTASYSKVWSYGGACGRGGCQGKVVTQIIGQLTHAKFAKSFFCYEAKTN